MSDDDNHEEHKWIKANKVAFLQYFGYFGEERKRKLAAKLEGKGR